MQVATGYTLSFLRIFEDFLIPFRWIRR